MIFNHRVHRGDMENTEITSNLYFVLTRITVREYAGNSVENFSDIGYSESFRVPCFSAGSPCSVIFFAFVSAIENPCNSTVVLTVTGKRLTSFTIRSLLFLSRTTEYAIRFLIASWLFQRRMVPGRYSFPE